MSTNNGFFGNSTFGLTGVNTSNTYRNLTKIGADTYPTHDDAKGSQNSQPHYPQPGNKLESFITNSVTFVTFTIPWSCTSLDKAYKATAYEGNSSNFVEVASESGNGESFENPITYFFDFGLHPAPKWENENINRQLYGLDYYPFESSGTKNTLDSPQEWERQVSTQVRISVAPYTRIVIFEGLDKNGKPIRPNVYYNRFDSLYNANIIPPNDIPGDLNVKSLADQYWWSWNFGPKAFLEEYEKSVYGSKAWLYLPTIDDLTK